MGSRDQEKGITAARASEIMGDGTVSRDEIMYVVQHVEGSGARNILAFAYSKAYKALHGKDPAPSDYSEDEAEMRMRAYELARKLPQKAA